MFKHILVPVDLTNKNAQAISAARELAQQSAGRLTVLHVIELLDAPFEEFRDFYERLELESAEEMDRMTAPLREADVPFRQKIVYGKRAEMVVETAERDEADLIVLHSHKVDLDNPGSGWATLSYKVAILAQCPILLMKEVSPKT
ncbi:MAG: universal stress protein [Gemmatimonadota bacterium]